MVCAWISLRKDMLDSFATIATCAKFLSVITSLASAASSVIQLSHHHTRFTLRVVTLDSCIALFRVIRNAACVFRISHFLWLSSVPRSSVHQPALHQPSLGEKASHQLISRLPIVRDPIVRLPILNHTTVSRPIVSHPSMQSPFVRHRISPQSSLHHPPLLHPSLVQRRCITPFRIVPHFSSPDPASTLIASITFA
jgi:hypothetical protein